MKFCYHCMHQIYNLKVNTCPNCGNELKVYPLPAKFLQPGTILQGRFIIGYPLGSGGFGNTYIGWNILLSRKVAVKEFFPKSYIGRSSDGMTVSVTHQSMKPRFERGLQEFLEEARTVASLQDIPWVVAISNFFEENGTGYIVMEHLEGDDVRSILKKNGGRMDYAGSREIVLSVLYTLKELHARKILHRDIAPDNVFVTKDGVVKLIDFGAARQAFAVANQNADIVLKVGYSPIEQYSHNEKQGPYSDLYSVAALFYRMLTGIKPAPANERYRRDTLLPPSQLGIRIPEQAEMGMMVCLNVRPEYRLQNAEDFMEALEGKDFIPKIGPQIDLHVPVNTAKHSPIPKIAVAVGSIVLASAAFAAGIMITRPRPEPVDERVSMPDFSEQSVEEVQEYVDELNREHYGWNITLNTEETVFDLSAEDGTICEQSVAPSTILYDPDSEEQTEIKNLTWDEDGNLTGTIFCSLYSSETISYGEMKDLSAYELAKKLDIDTADASHFVAVEDTNKDYYELVKIQMAEETVSAKKLNKKKNKEKELHYDKDSAVIYYAASEFFYWDEMPNFRTEFGNLVDVEFPVYKWQNETDKIPTYAGSKVLYETNAVARDYYTVYDTYEIGDVITQTVKVGKKVDTSKNSDKVLVHVIGEKLTLVGKTGNAAKKELEALSDNITVEAGGSKDMSQPVLGIEKMEDDEGNEIRCFLLTDKVIIRLKLRTRPTPVPTRAPSSGGSSGGGGGGSSSGFGGTSLSGGGPVHSVH